ncbi:MAG: hypothetical protein JXB00_04515 [Bacteroidales bacterium]|nr:hypothetical protein [Bacteroidales bacterium]
MKAKFVVILFLAAIIMACEEKEEEKTYVGTWEYAEENDTLQATPVLIVLNQKMVLTLNADTWQMLMNIRVQPAIPEWTEYLGFKGAMTIEGEDIQIVFTHVGIRQINYQTLTFIDDEVVWYSEAEDPNMFGSLFDEYGPEHTTISGKMVVNGDKLTLKMDENLNGQIEDEEIQEFTRVN